MDLTNGHDDHVKVSVGYRDEFSDAWKGRHIQADLVEKVALNVKYQRRCQHALKELVRLGNKLVGSKGKV